MAHTPEHSLLAQGQAAGQGPDIFELAQQAQGRQQRQQPQQQGAVPGTGVAAIDIFTVKGRREEQARINAAAGRVQSAGAELDAVTAADTQIAASGIDTSQLQPGREAGLQRLGIDDPA